MDAKKAFLGSIFYMSLCLALFMLVLHVCLAQDEEESTDSKIFDDWVTEGTQFQVSGLDVFVAAGDTAGEGIFIFPQKTIVLKDGTCLMVDRLKVCQSEWSYLIGGTVKIHGEDKQKYHITITVPAPDVSISRSPAEAEIEVGEETRVTVVLKNGGSEPALGLTYKETIPREFEITMTNNAEQQGNRIVWQGSIPAGEEIKLAYNIRAKSPFAGEIPATLEYKVHNVPKKISDYMQFEAQSLIDIGQKRDKNELQVGDEDRFYITLKNKRGEDAAVELYVNVPKALYVVATHFNDTTAENSFLWKGTLGGGEETTFITRVRADDTGNFKVNVSVHALFTDSKSGDAQEYIDMNVSMKEAELYFIPKKIKKGEESIIKLYLKNPNTYLEFSNLDISASSQFFNGTIHLDRFKPLEYNEVLVFKVKSEDVMKFDAKADVSYEAGSKKLAAKKTEKLEVTEEKPPEEKPPETNETAVNNTETKPAEQPANGAVEAGMVGLFGWNDLFTVQYAGEKAGEIGGNIGMMLELKAAVSDAVSAAAEKKKGS